ncbi:MAG: hypothetical protein AABX23_04835 [Nanoarchaeota archaeon]
MRQRAKIAIAVLLVAVLGLVLFFFNREEASNEISNSPEMEEGTLADSISEGMNEDDTEYVQSAEVSWDFDFNNEVWKSSGDVPLCPEPLVIDSPVDVSLATGILYPGQERGGDYKPHGGFRFDNQQTNGIDVVAPMEGNLFRASHYLENGEVQYLLFFMNDCGIMYKFDHLRTLTEKFEKLFENLPPPQEGDSRTTEIYEVSAEKGELIATEVGFKEIKNVAVDFGLYDLRKTNEASKDQGWATEHSDEKEFGFNALCWLDNLPEPPRSTVKGLPGSGSEGKKSDYCR